MPLSSNWLGPGVFIAQIGVRVSIGVLGEKYVRHFRTTIFCCVTEVDGAKMEWGEESISLFEPKHNPDCYIVFNNKYYDAEEPYGVDNPTKLPIYHRQVDKIVPIH